MRRLPDQVSIREVVTHVIALAVLAFTGAVLWPALTDGDEGLKRAQSILAVLGPMVGTILGFYFGTRSGEQVAQQARQSEVEAKVTGVEEVEAARQREQSLLDRARELLARVQELESKKGGPTSE